MEHHFIIDGSLESILCATFEWFERKPGKVRLVEEENYQPSAFSLPIEIYCDERKADRVWNGLAQLLSKAWLRQFYAAYLSELPDIHNKLFEFTCYIFKAGPEALNNYGNNSVLEISKIAKRVERERHRMEAFIRFQQAADGIFFCRIEPDFDVVPLLIDHFRNRYKDQKWIIFDMKRKYGALYDLKTVEFVRSDGHVPSRDADLSLNNFESHFATLWKTYFKSTNIAARKNLKLHLRHVPKRYWKYLTEKT